MKRQLKYKKNKRKYIYIFIFVLLALPILLLIFGNKETEKGQFLNKTTKKQKEVIKKESNELTLVMTGDCLVHKSVYNDAKIDEDTYSFSKMFAKVKPIIEKHDLAYYNQESIIGGKDLGLAAYPRFNSPEEVGEDMINLGFNLVSLATNHTMDKGEKGVENSVNFWNSKKSVYATGQALSQEERDDIRIESKNGISYAMLSYTIVTNGLLPPKGKEYLTNIYSDEKAKKDIEKIRDKVDLLIVAMHWGQEYINYPTANQKQVAKYLSSLGVNIIIGTHPHVLQPIEKINDTLVLYSLGNFISAQDTPDKLTGALVSLKIKKEKDKIVISDVKSNLIYTMFNNLKDFEIVPYNLLKVTDKTKYKKYYDKYEKILRSLDENVEVVSLYD